MQANVQTIIGCTDSQRFGFILVKENDYVQGKNILKETVSSVDVQKEFRDVFKGRGYLGEPLKFEVDETVTPVVHAPRRVPYSLQ